MNSATPDDDAWLNALLESGPAEPATPQPKVSTTRLAFARAIQTEPVAQPQAAAKLARLQRAFAQLHQAEPDALDIDENLRFHWHHLAVLDRLGAGGYGEVFRAYDSVLEREVALKLRRANNQFSPAAGLAFIDEARRLARVRHPNVLAVHGAAIDQSRAGIWTDLLIGETLATRIMRDGPMPYAMLLALATDLAAALGAVHAQAIVHGDLKPANVMCEAGKDGAFVLMDFGAGASLDARGETRLSAGTLHFIAPEQLAGAAVGTSVDVYALGASLYFAATGKAFAKPTQFDTCVFAKARTAGFAKANRIGDVEQLPKDFVNLLTSMLLLAPQHRPSAESILAQCQTLLGAAERLSRQRLQLALVTVLLLAVLIELGALWLTLRARAATELEANRAIATKDFLLAMLRNTNPYQSPNPTRSLATFFASAVQALPGAFQHDPRSEATLLNQFGRSFIVLDKDQMATSALLRADQLLADAGIALNDETRIDIRSYLGNTYRMRREYGNALTLSAEQAPLCAPGNHLPVRTCIFIINDRAQALGFSGDPALALALLDENLVRAQAADLHNDDRAAVIYLLQATMRRELGQSAGARVAFITYSDAAIAALPSKHPGILVNLSWLAWCADDLANVALARQLNRAAIRLSLPLYNEKSHYVAKLRLQEAILALHANDQLTARQNAGALLAWLPKESKVFAPYVEQATLILALAGGEVSPAGDTEKYFSPTGDTEKYFSPAGDTEKYFSPAGDTEKYFSPTGDTEKYFSPTGDTEKYFSPVGDTEKYFSPVGDTEKYFSPAGDVGKDRTDMAIDSALHSRAAVLGESSVKLAELRLGMAAVALKRAQLIRAAALLDQAKAVVASAKGGPLQALYWRLCYHLAKRTIPIDAFAADAANAASERVLAQRQQLLFDPVSALWIGQAPADYARSSADIEAAAARIYAARAKGNIDG
jgi:serine/threonine protein kinase